MEELFARVWENLIARTEGPMNLRFFIQPLTALIFAVRTGLKDAKSDAVPYLWRFLVAKEKRLNIAKEGWKDFGKIFIVGLALDSVYQLVVIFKVKSEERRGPVNRLLSLIKHRNQS